MRTTSDVSPLVRTSSPSPQPDLREVSYATDRKELSVNYFRLWLAMGLVIVGSFILWQVPWSRT